MYFCFEINTVIKFKTRKMKTKSYYKKGELVKTPHGNAEVTVVDIVNKSVRVKHLEAKTPITDYRFSDLLIN